MAETSFFRNNKADRFAKNIMRSAGLRTGGHVLSRSPELALEIKDQGPIVEEKVRQEYSTGSDRPPVLHIISGKEG